MGILKDCLMVVFAGSEVLGIAVLFLFLTIFFTCLIGYLLSKI